MVLPLVARVESDDALPRWPPDRRVEQTNGASFVAPDGVRDESRPSRALKSRLFAPIAAYMNNVSRQQIKFILERVCAIHDRRAFPKP